MYQQEQQQELLCVYDKSVLISAYSNVFDDLPFKRSSFYDFPASVQLMVDCGVSIDEMYKNGVLDRDFVYQFRSENQAVYKAWRSDVLNKNFSRNKSKFKENYAKV